jgi:hypothetical protein
MKTHGTLFAAAGITLLTAGCQSLPQAALVYASRQTLGISVSTPSQAQPEPLNFTVGFGNQDVAYVPVVADGCNTIDADYQRNLERDKKGGGGDSTVNCFLARKGVTTSEKPTATARTASNSGFAQLPRLTRVADENAETVNTSNDNAETPTSSSSASLQRTAASPYDLLHKDGNSMKIEDANSVLGTFGSSLSLGGANATQSLGKFFSTGVAAQQLAEGFAYKQAAEGYAQYVSGLATCVDSMKKKLPNASDSEILTYCSAGLSGLLKQNLAAQPTTPLSAGTNAAASSPQR